MTNPFLALDSASFVLPDGRMLFSELTVQFDLRPTGLVGRNGVGKTALARILAGPIAPGAGRVVRSGAVYYLPQHVVPGPSDTVAVLAGVAPVLQALARIEEGSADPADFDAVGERWDTRQRLAIALDQYGLGHLPLDHPASALSGGEAMRVALAGAWLAEPDFLLLDEPTNHLDRAQRLALIAQLQRWPKGLLAISHDRELLETMSRIVELSPSGLRDYGGGYTFYAEARARERDGAAQELARRKRERQRIEAELREQRERLERRTARGAREGREANQAKILLGRRKEKNEATAGKQRSEQLARREEMNESVRDAARHIDRAPVVALAPPPLAGTAQRKVLTLEGVVLPYGIAAARPLDLIVTGHQRIGLTGCNGSGKSTLLRLIAGRLDAAGGRCVVHVRTAYLSQQLETLDPARSALDHLRMVHPDAPQGDLRARLALLGLDADTVTLPTAVLSGGERTKAALAGVLYAKDPPELLLLDEPTNHLDLDTVRAIEQVLHHYTGAIVAVSHDEAFLDGLRPDIRLSVSARGWQTEPW